MKTTSATSPGRARRALRRAATLVLITPLMAIVMAGAGSTASPWNVDIVTALRSGMNLTLAGTAYSPAGQQSGNYLQVEWGDGSSETLPNFLGQGPWAWGPLSHTYAAEGTYTVTATLLHASPNGNDRNAFDTVVIVIPDPGDPDPDEVDVQVSLGTCLSDGTTSSTPLNVVISGDGDATVTILDDEDEVVATFSGSGSEDLAPGSYTYSTTADEGSALSATSDAGGLLDVIDCSSIVDAQGSVNVALGACDSADGDSLTPVNVVIAPEGAATVFLSTGDAVVATFTGGGGSMDAVPGDYVWTASPAEGFELTGPVAGQLAIDDCPSIVLGDPPLNRDTAKPTLPKQLARTGATMPALIAMAMLFMVAGAVINIRQRRAPAVHQG